MAGKGYDPIEMSRKVEEVVVRGDKRKYYRLGRAGRFYGGSCAADCVGCNLSCVFCWSNMPRLRPDLVGRFYTPKEVFDSLIRCSRARGYGVIRVSGNEPTIGREHLLRLLDLVERSGDEVVFVLETNGILLGHDPTYAEELSGYRKLHVRVSIKACDEEGFHRLTGALPEAFRYQLMALKNLIDNGVSAHPAVMVSFCSEGELRELIRRLASIDPSLPASLEPEVVVLYPHVRDRLRKAGIRPRVFREPWSGR